MKIKKGDTVLIIKGKDRKKKGKIFQSLPKEGKILVEGVNLKKKHQRGRRQGEKGQVVLVPGALPVSNVKLICPKCGKPSRVGYRITNKIKVRVCKKCNQEI